MRDLLQESWWISVIFQIWIGSWYTIQIVYQNIYQRWIREYNRYFIEVKMRILCFVNIWLMMGYNKYQILLQIYVR